MLQSDKPLSEMSVGDVVNLINNVEGFSQRMLGDYAQRLMDNNINGTVLLSCDLTELKQVLQMAFGDWVLFQSMVESLRYSEQTGAESYDGEVSPAMEVFVRPTAIPKTAGAKSTSIAATTGVLTTVTSNSSASKKATASDVTLTSTVSNGDVLPAPAVSRSSPTMKEPVTTTTLVAGDRGAPPDEAKSVPTPSPKIPLKRQDSFVDEVLMESETLRGFIQASVVGSDSEGGTPNSDDEDVQRPITTIPEETQVSRNTSDSSLGRLSLRQVAIARRTSVESGPMDRAFSVGPDQDSGESDSEVERVSRRSSIRQIPTAQCGGTGGSKPDTVIGSEERRKKSRSKSMKHDASHHSRHATKLVSKSNSATKLDRGSGGGSECSVPLMSLYFPMVCKTTHGRTESQSSSYISPKASVSAISPALTGSPSRHSETTTAPAVDSDYSQSSPPLDAALLSWQPHPQPTSSTATSSNHEASLLSQPTEAITSDSVKFFIVDESDTSPKAIMVEMESIPPHHVISSVTGDPSTYHDPDHVAV